MDKHNLYKNNVFWHIWKTFIKLNPFLLFFALLNSIEPHARFWHFETTSKDLLGALWGFFPSIFLIVQSTSRSFDLLVLIPCGGDAFGGNLPSGQLKGDNLVNIFLTNTWSEFWLSFSATRSNYFECHLTWLDASSSLLIFDWKFTFSWSGSWMPSFASILIASFSLGVVSRIGTSFAISSILRARDIIGGLSLLWDMVDWQHFQLVMTLSQIGQFCNPCTHDPQNVEWLQVCKLHKQKCVRFLACVHNNLQENFVTHSKKTSNIWVKSQNAKWMVLKLKAKIHYKI